MNIVDQAVNALVETRELAGRKVVGVWVFGSQARGDAGPDSDIDLAVLCEPALGLDRLAVMDRVALKLGQDVDVVDMAPAPPALAWEVITTGRLVLEGDVDRLHEAMRAARYAAEDDEQRARMVLLADVGNVGGATA